ncbi:Flp pilus assembly complex ATPase component TadA [Coriobacteriia bacterium Es71-Z0120]|uniref:GspE/PulE family protein n=1 Tax=Parvivirga hydrogeniphila TaxID=2939460 RepID=UPI002260A143|nr:ATPase, T2SS/T4P/T4SS family [Parvivirga hydrogeniphila]MCL4079038.1 Flp pilus assembly complex ATPase component TadA [Parvivirga hydrogeniphila]
MAYTREKLGEILIRAGLITQEQLDAALAVQAVEGGKLGQILVRQLVLDEDEIAQTLAEQKGLEYVRLTSFPIDREAVTQIPERLARRRLVIPIAYRGDALVLAMADPLDVEALDDVRLRSGREVVPVVATPTQIQYAIEKYLASADALQDVVEAVPEDEEETVAVEEDAPVVRLVNQIIREAVVDGASDIHVEPGEHAVRVRFRVDGVLHERMQLPLSVRPGLTSRVKIMADMDISERRRPQDGRIAVTVNGRPVDIRVATLPTPAGESIVLRILNHDVSLKTLEDLGMGADHLETMRRFLARPWGAVLVSGPTGSGKTTTLYAGISRINEPARKIITIEDPIEYRIAGITQMSVNPGIGLTFAALLRTVLRADPDVVLVGEIRDPETAEIAIRAALTGHLVLSSIHTNDAPSALTRLVDMDVEPYITSSALVGVVAQRLARRLCPTCKKRYKVTPETALAAGFSEEEVGSGLRLYKAVGCDECAGTGYRGRVGLFEIMEMDEDLQRLFLREAPAEQLRVAALQAGMRSLRRDALDKVKAGVTSLDEVARVVV